MESRNKLRELQKNRKVVCFNDRNAVICFNNGNAVLFAEFGIGKVHLPKLHVINIEWIIPAPEISQWLKIKVNNDNKQISSKYNLVSSF